MDKKKKKEVLAKFGENLKALRLQKNLSYRELAARCDVDHSDIKKYEDGLKNLTLITIVDLAMGLEVEVRELVGFDL
jgi:transcriptional regulator with XRE-family HTH domain